MPVEILTLDDLRQFKKDLLGDLNELIDEKVLPRVKSEKVLVVDAAKEFHMTVKSFKTTGIPWYEHDDNPRKDYCYRKDIDVYEARRIAAKENLNPKRK
ncbi:MAG: hypothetical protein QM669_12445 [Siphonobacter sp.]